jgi:hypothetical protein
VTVKAMAMAMAMERSRGLSFRSKVASSRTCP